MLAGMQKRQCKQILRGLTLSMLLILLLSCSKSANTPINDTIQYSSFRDIPGITEDEIKAVEELQNKIEYFIYGMTPGTELFLNDGVPGGFSVLLCEWLSGLFEIPFKPVIYKWGDLIAGLENGKIDFTGELTPNDERRKVYTMTSSIAQRKLIYVRIKDSRRLSEIAKERPVRFAFLDGTNTYNNVVSSGVFDKIEPLYIHDNESAYDLLKNGKADAFLKENSAEAAFDTYSDIVIEDFFPNIFSPVSLAAQNKELESIISIVQKALNDNKLRYLAGLYNQGYRDYLKHKLSMRFTEEEKAYLQKRPVVSFAAEYDNYPLCFFNTREGNWQGIAFDVMSEIQKLTDLTFISANKNNQRIAWPVMVKMLEDGEVSMLTELIRSEERKDRFIWPDTSIITDNYALLSKAEHNNISTSEILYVRVGLPKGTAYTEAFKNWFPDHKHTVEYESSALAFNALDQNEIDMVMSSQYRFLLLTNFLEKPYYKANVVFDRTFNSTFGFNKNEALLCSIIDKTLALIDVTAISDQWMRKTFDYRVKLMQAQIPWFIGATVLVLVLSFLLILFIRNRYESIRLENTVKERTIELNNSQRELETALEAAKNANMAKSVFLANMSHEIRTPLNSIMGFSELAMDGEASSRTKDYLGKILTNAEWLLNVITDILNISKIESGKMELELIPFDFHELFTSCRTIVLPKAEEKGIILHFYAEPSIGKLPLGDPAKLRQVLVNLLSNAVKFTNTGKVTLFSSINQKTENTITLNIEVKDSGIGMTKEQIEKIFKPFTQAESGTTRKYGGTGLGLTICKNIIELMGGQLSVESIPGIGSKFSFELTFDTIDVSGNELSKKKIPFKDLEKPIFEGEVLLCEDNAMNQQVIYEHLARVGLQTVVAENGKIGVEIFQNRLERGEKMFNLILMDIHMPVMDGIEASLKIMEYNTGIPIVALTANIIIEDKENYRVYGINDCVSKPFTSQELWRCLMNYFTPLNRKDIQENRQQIETDRVFQEDLKQYFFRNNRKKYEEITKALETNNIKEAHILAHNLKSNAGYIEKKQLQKIASDIEYHLKDGKNLVTDEQLKNLKSELTVVLKEFSSLQDRFIKQPVVKPTLDRKEVLDLLNKLEPMLKKGNPECLSYIDNLRAIKGSKELIQQIDNFEFDNAFTALVKLKASITRKL